MREESVSTSFFYGLVMSSKKVPVYKYKSASRHAGIFAPLPKTPYKVHYKRLTNKKDTRKTLVLALANTGVELGFLGWLLLSLFSLLWNAKAHIGATFLALLASIFIIESFRLVSIVSLALSAFAAREPIPVRPAPGRRVAFTTAIVPSKEPFERVKLTLQAMKNIKYDGKVDVWLLDEENDPAIKLACKKMGVKHFTRLGVEKWNTTEGTFKTRTKHGNYNAWLMSKGKRYEYVLSVDSDHIPQQNFAQRMLGYFRDDDVAFVVGPQVYGNTDTVIARGAESQSYVFQATIQRAGNAYHTAMFVGTNHAYRVSSMLQIGGFQDSITEDLLTSLTIHSTRNTRTGSFWKSVYTPDVLAVGEGPSTWTDYFSQQLRWSRGANEILLKHFGRIFRKLPWRSRVHYGLIIWCYPAAAITWSVGIAVSLLYLFLGKTGVGLHDKTWLALYIDVLATQLFLYAWLRRYNVSPHEERGSFGAAGIIFSIFAAPVYVYALFCTLLRRKAKFVVTPKGDTVSPDSWRTFKNHLLWASLVGGFLIYTIIIGNTVINVKIWSAIALVSCLTPVVMWQMSIWKLTRERMAAYFRPLRKLFNRPVQEGIEI